MSIILEISHGERGERCTYRAELDDETVAWLVGIAEACHAQPALIATSILRNVREDDEAAEKACDITLQ